MPATEDIHLTGHCYCGGVTYAVDIPAGQRPLFALYCHCDSCRRAHAAPLYHVVCVDETMLEVTAGADLLTAFGKERGPVRTFCSRCGSKMLNRFGNWKPDGRVPVAFFPDTLDESMRKALPDILRPTRNNCADECVLDTEVLRQMASA